MWRLLPGETLRDSEEGCFVEFTLRYLDSFAADGKKRPFLTCYHVQLVLHVGIYLRSWIPTCRVRFLFRGERPLRFLTKHRVYTYVCI
jgi:hypothetical protein